MGSQFNLCFDLFSNEKWLMRWFIVQYLGCKEIVRMIAVRKDIYNKVMSSGLCWRSCETGKEDVIATIHLDVEGVNRVGHLVSQALSVSGITAVGSLNVQDGIHIIHELLVGHVGKRGLNNHHLSSHSLSVVYHIQRVVSSG